MARTYKTIDGLTYQNLDDALRQLGYVREEQIERVIYRYPANEKAILFLPNRPLSEEVRGIDLLAAREIVDGFDIKDARDFDVLLLRVAGTPVSTVAP